MPFPAAGRTPTYMSPEQLNSRSGREKGYLGTAVDVWASGVWLTVMLVRGRCLTLSLSILAETIHV